MKRYPQLNWDSFKGLPSEVARQPKSGNQAARDVKTYLATDVDALVARPYVENCLSDPDRVVREAAASTLGAMRQPASAAPWRVTRRSARTQHR